MKKSTKFIALALFPFALLGIASCADKPSETSSQVTESISLSESSLDLVFGDTHELSAIASSPDNVTWESSNAEVAKVEGGTVKAVGRGEAKITARCGFAYATCQVKVSFGNYLPSLLLDQVGEEGIQLAQGSSFVLRGYASFRDELYSCPISVTLQEDGVLSYENQVLTGKKEGETEITVAGSWNGFSNALMEKKIRVKVSKDVSVYCQITSGGKTLVANSVSLGLIDSWQGELYETTAKLSFKAVDGGTPIEASIVTEDNDVVDISEDGTIKAKKAGGTKVYGSYTGEDGRTYSTFVSVTVTCPVATYQGQLRVSSETPFPTSTYFGEGATLTYVKQGERELNFSANGLIKGLSAAGDASESLLILTNKGGFYFENSFVYTKAITASNFASVFQLASGRIVDGYYILEEDIAEIINMTSQMGSYYAAGDANSRYFKGTFDGQGHTLKAKVGREGIFGGLGESAVIKNAHFEFTFASSDYCSGLARNNWTNNVTGWGANLDNLYVTTTNYYDHSYALFETRFNNLVMKDIYVDLTLDSSCLAVTKASQEKGALFRVDNTISSGPYGQFYGDFRNVYVVSSVFMPIASGTQGKNLFASYAKNDVDKLGSFDYAGASEEAMMHCVLGSKEDNEKKDLFGDLPGVTWYFKATQNTDLAWAYFAQPTISNGGIVRYDTKEELLSNNVSQIGSWRVESSKA